MQTIEIEASELIVAEDTVVSVTRSGYIKRTSPRSFASSALEEIGKRDDDELLYYANAKTTQHLLIFTNLGNVIYRQFMNFLTFAGRILENICHKVFLIFHLMKK